MRIESWLLVFAMVIGLSNRTSASDVHVDVFAAKSANVNSFIIYDSVGSVIVDTTRSSKEANEVAKLARTHGTGPNIIFITHGHPDHFLGMGALKVEFPNAKFLVANQDVKDDILRFAEMAEKSHLIDDEPLMKPKSVKNPNGFDYQHEIQVMTGTTLDLPEGEKLEVLSNFPPTEAAHETLLFSKSLNALFASDLVYNGVHLWLGSGVSANSVENWKDELRALEAQYSPLKIKVYPGHGRETDPSIFETDLNYVNDILNAVKISKTKEEAKAIMTKKYLHWNSSDFILNQSLKNLFELKKERQL